MRPFVIALALIAALSALPSVLMAQDRIEVGVTYRERIALPPDAALEVQLLDISRADRAAGRIASQRFRVTGVPMTVALHFDPGVIEAGASYAVSATIWSGDRPLFRTTDRHDAFGDAPLQIVLTMVPGLDAGTAPPPRSISGVQWAVTELEGDAWGTEDPATLAVDDAMNLSVFGGCNRFVGQVTLSEGQIAFPSNFAGTLMACPDKVEALERRLLSALSRVTSYQRSDAGLIMTDAEGKAILRLVERPE